MFILKHTIASLAIFSLLLTPAFADEIFSFKTGYLTLTPSGDFGVSADSASATILDLENDLGVGDDDGYFLDAGLQMGSFRLSTAYLPINFSGDAILTQDVSFNGKTFVLGSRVKSDIKIDIYDAGLTWYLVNLDDTPARIQFGPEVSVKYVDARVGMQNSALGLDESKSVGVPVPTVGARARVALADFLGVVGRVGYAEYDGNRFMDVDGQVEFSPVPMVGVFAGYRYLDVKVDHKDLFIDATFAGPYAGALIRF